MFTAEIIKPSVSIIIPVYNVENYLHQCIDSVLSQTLQDFEVILVDDGSNDKSGLICDKYAEKDNRVKVIHKQNGGLVSARKAGYEASIGQYISNIDADDWVEPNHLEVLYNAMINTGADISQSGYFINEDNEERKEENKPTSENPKQVITDFLTGKVHSGVVFKLISRHLYEAQNFCFPPCDFNEDLHTSISLTCNARKYAYVPKCTYHYRRNALSMTKRLTIDDKFRKYRESMTNLQDLLIRLNIDNQHIYSKANASKRGFVKFFPTEHERLKEVLAFFPQSYQLTDVRTVGDLFYYLACRWHILLPYRIKALLR